MRARRSRMRSIAAPKSESSGFDPGRPIAAALRDSAARRDSRITPFEGTQPTFRQSPPIMWRSISATRAPMPAATAAVISPPVPAPITTRL